MASIGARFPLPSVSEIVIRDEDATGTPTDPRTDLELDTLTHDIVIRAGDVQLLGGPRVRGQRIKVTLLHLRGEWFLDTSLGTDWFGSVLGKSTDMMRRVELRRQLRTVPGVRDVQRLALRLDPNTRVLSGTIDVLDMSGARLEVPVKGV